MILDEIFGLLDSTLGFILAIKNLQGGLELFAGIIMLVIGLNFAGLWPGWMADPFPGVNIFKRIISGLWQIKIFWQEERIEFYQEEAVILD